jgi:RHS repeat-associated protein
VNGEDRAGYDCGESGADTGIPRAPGATGEPDSLFFFRSSNGDPRVRPGYNGNGGYGIDIYNDSAANYVPWSWGSWVWRAPNQAFIYRAEFGLFRFGGGGDPVAVAVIQGVGSKADPAVWEDKAKGAYAIYVDKTKPAHQWPKTESPVWVTGVEDWTWRTHCVRPGCGPDDAANPIAPANEYRMMLTGVASRPATFAHLGAAYMYLQDRDRPTFTDTGAAPPPHWVERHSATVTIAARDPSLGMKTLFFRTPGGQKPASVDPCAGGNAHSGSEPAWGRCDAPHSASFGYDTGEGAGWPEGLNWVEVGARDVVGNYQTGGEWQRGLQGKPVKIDRSNPTLELGGTMREGRGGELLWREEYTLDVTARDGIAGGTDAQQRSGAKRILIESRYENHDITRADSTLAPGERLESGQTIRSPSGQFMLAMQSDGNLALWNSLGQRYWESRTAGNSGARVVMQTDGNLVVYSTDDRVLWSSGTAGNRLSRAVLQDDGNLVIYSATGPAVWSTNTAVNQNGTGWVPRHDTGAHDCPAGSCEMKTTWRMRPANWESYPGRHTVRVTAFDQLDHKEVKTFAIVVPPPRNALVDTDELIGLEDWWHYRSTPTGAGSGAHVNVANGNLVWHTVPIVNPGRGLASVVNLTYNSHQRVQVPLLETPLEQAFTPYDEVGRGFSLGISSLTRLNERLNVDLAGIGRVTLTDPDGTRHLFHSDPGGEVFTAPPGVHLHLRRFSPDRLGVPSPVGYTPVEDPRKAWAATRPDGVTFYFDQRGYPTTVEDRNCVPFTDRPGFDCNTLTFRYEYRGVTRDVCDAAARSDIFVLPEAVCQRKLVAVADEANREIRFTYEQRNVAGATGTCTEGTIEKATCASGRLRTITDHLDRPTHFEYTGADLTAVRTPDPTWPTGSRNFRFGYEGAAGGLTRTPLTSVTDPRGSQTKFTYGAGPVGPTVSPLLFGRPITAVVDRNEATPATDDVERATTFAYTNEGTVITDTRGNSTRHVVDGQGRLTNSHDALGRRTQLTWDDNDHNLIRLTRHADGGLEAATTTMTYNDRGYLTSSSDRNLPETNPQSRLRTTRLRYIESNGVAAHRSPRVPLNGTVPIDANRTFVSDLDTITTPAGGTTDFNYEAGNTGNVVNRVDAEGNVAHTTYIPGRPGLIETETDEEGNRTRYADYGGNGLPQTVTDARGNIWRYEYDRVGNLLRARDPRWTGAACGTTRQRFRTEFFYDALDRVRGELIPKDSAGCRFIARSYDYDANGNRTVRFDALSRTWRTTYTRMDDVDQQISPQADHIDGFASEVTDLEYDSEENLTKVVSPNGTQTPTVADDFTTEFRYNGLNQRVASIRHQPGGTPSRLATGFMYDGRGNLIAISDPKRNAAAGGQPEANVVLPQYRRFTFQYDLADNRILSVENPAPLNAQDPPDPDADDLRTRYTYDDNDNLASVTNPRNSTTSYAYDRRDLLTDMTNGEAERTHYELRGDGKVEVEISPRGMTSGAGAPADANGDAVGNGYYRTVYDYFPTGELRSITQPAAPNQYAPVAPRTVYERNAVGDPIRITDPRGRAFDNTFFDTGDLRSTGRPSWWIFDPAAADQGGDPLTEPPTMPGPLEPGVQRPGGQIRERTPEERLELADKGETPALPVSEGVGDRGSVDPEEPPELLPRATPGGNGVRGATWFDYDDEMQLETVSTATEPGDVMRLWASIGHDAVGRIRSTLQPFDGDRLIINGYRYDRNGNLRSHTDPENHLTTLQYDQFDRLTQRTTPGSGDPEQREVTDFGYDENGNLTSRNTPRGELTWTYGYDDVDRVTSATDPRGTATPNVPGDFTTDYRYDRAGNRRLVETPVGRRTEYDYDNANRLIEITAPLGIVTTFDYDEDGNQTEMVEPGPEGRRIVTRRTFDGRGLQWAETIGTAAPRTTVKEFDPNGNLRRVVNPAGVDATTRRPTRAWNGAVLTPTSTATENATVREYSDDNLVTSINLPYGDPDGNGGAPTDDRRMRQEFDRDHLGRVHALRAPFEWEPCERPADPNDPGCASTTIYTHYDSGWIRSMSDPVITNPDGTTENGQAVDYDYDRRGNQTHWTSRSANEEHRRVVRSYWPNGLLRTRTASTSDDRIPRRIYRHEYNRNRSLTSITEELVNNTNVVTRTRPTRMTYNDAEQQVLVNERWAVGKDTAYAYDDDGNVTSRRTDGSVTQEGQPATYTGGKTTSFVYDLAGREQEMRVCTEGALPICNTNDTPERRTVTEYYPLSGFIQRRNKFNNGVVRNVVETFEFRDDGQIARMERRDLAGNTVKNQPYAYDANGNRTRDERGTHLFNAREQLIAWTRGEDHDDDDTVAGSRVCYRLNAAGSILRKTDTQAHQAEPGDVECRAREYLTTNYTYNGERLLATRTTASGHTPTNVVYDYDDFGNVERIAPENRAPTTFAYDQFGRMIRSRGPGEDEDRDYRYDALDRRDIRIVHPGAPNERHHDYSYVGLTEKLAREIVPEDGGGTTTKFYDYDSGMRRQGQETRGSGVSRYRSYAKDANGSVEGLEHPDGTFGPGGDANDEYLYDPYGELEEDEDQDGEIGAEARQNPFRFQGFYYDSAIRTYDMQARPYRPEIGRFLTPDSYESASGDLTLQVDPLTQNRYAFAGGNPVNHVEWDGHCSRALRETEKCGGRIDPRDSEKLPDTPPPSPLKETGKNPTGACTQCGPGGRRSTPPRAPAARDPFSLFRIGPHRWSPPSAPATTPKCVNVFLKTLCGPIGGEDPREGPARDFLIDAGAEGGGQLLERKFPRYAGRISVGGTVATEAIMIGIEYHEAKEAGENAPFLRAVFRWGTSFDPFGAELIIGDRPDKKRNALEDFLADRVSGDGRPDPSPGPKLWPRLRMPARRPGDVSPGMARRRPYETYPGRP